MVAILSEADVIVWDSLREEIEKKAVFKIHRKSFI
jgi:hypothetical protein